MQTFLQRERRERETQSFHQFPKSRSSLGPCSLERQSAVPWKSSRGRSLPIPKWKHLCCNLCIQTNEKNCAVSIVETQQIHCVFMTPKKKIFFFWRFDISYCDIVKFCQLYPERFYIPQITVTLNSSSKLTPLHATFCEFHADPSAPPFWHYSSLFPPQRGPQETPNSSSYDLKVP